MVSLIFFVVVFVLLPAAMCAANVRSFLHARRAQREPLALDGMEPFDPNLRQQYWTGAILGQQLNAAPHHKRSLDWTLVGIVLSGVCSFGGV